MCPVWRHLYFHSNFLSERERERAHIIRDNTSGLVLAAGDCCAIINCFKKDGVMVVAVKSLYSGCGGGLGNSGSRGNGDKYSSGNMACMVSADGTGVVRVVFTVVKGRVASLQQ